MHVKTKFFLGVLILALIVSFAFLYIGKMQRKADVYDFLPQLRSYNLYDVRFEKIYADPSYTVPYNVLISFKEDTQNVFEGLGLKDVHTVDTATLKKAAWVEEYRLYFTMYSINAIRYKSIANDIKAIKWWNIAGCNNNYAAPYFDKNNKKGVVSFGQKNNGRVVCCRRGNVYYILIECWG